MSQYEETPEPTRPESVGPVLALGLLSIWVMAPVTLPVPVLRELVQQRFDVSELSTSLFMSINMVGALVAAPVAGALADRWGRRRPLLIGALLVDALAFWALSLHISFGAFLAIRFIEGCAHITALSMLLALASNCLSPERRGRAMGIVGGAMMLGVALGAPLGGFLGRSSPLLPLQVAGALALAAMALASLVVRETTQGDEHPELGRIYRVLRVHPRLLVPLAFAFADRFTVGFFTTTFSLYVSRIHGLESGAIGLAIAAFMIPFALLSYPIGRAAENRSLIALLCGGSALYGLGTLAVGFVAPPALNILMFTIGVTAAVMFVPSMVLTTQLAPDSIRGTALGAFNAAGSLGFIVGPIVGGSISQWVADQSNWVAGYRAAFAAAGASELLCVALTLPFLLALRRSGQIR